MNDMFPNANDWRDEYEAKRAAGMATKDPSTERWLAMPVQGDARPSRQGEMPPQRAQMSMRQELPEVLGTTPQSTASAPYAPIPGLVDDNLQPLDANARRNRENATLTRGYRAVLNPTEGLREAGAFYTGLVTNKAQEVGDAMRARRQANGGAQPAAPNPYTYAPQPNTEPNLPDGVQVVPNRYTQTPILGRDTNNDGKLDAFADSPNVATLFGGPAAPLPQNGNARVIGSSSDGGRTTQFTVDPGTQGNTNDLSVANRLQAQANEMREGLDSRNRQRIADRRQRAEALQAYRAQRNQQALVEDLNQRADRLGDRMGRGGLTRGQREAMAVEMNALRQTSAAMMAGGRGGSDGASTLAQQVAAARVGIDQQQLGLNQQEFVAERQENARTAARQEYEAASSEQRARLALAFGEDRDGRSVVPDVMAWYPEARPFLEDKLNIQLPPNLSTATDAELGQVFKEFQQNQSAWDTYRGRSFINPMYYLADPPAY